MDPHRLAEERSVAYHREIAARLVDEPALLDEARARVEGWISAAAIPPYYACRWREILDQPAPMIQAFLTERSEEATELRQSSPFAGAIAPRRRWELWRRTRDANEAQ